MDDDEAPGVPEWVVTYGDMMSLLLTFFIMLVSLSEVVADKKYRAILDALQQYQGYAGAPVAPPGKSFPLNTVIERMEIPSLGSTVDDDLGAGGVRSKSAAGEDIRVFRLREGDSLRVGDFLEFAGENVDLTPQLEEQIQQIAYHVAGKPQKLEVRAYLQATESDPTLAHQAEQRAFLRSRAVQQRLEQLGIDRDRIRLSLLPESISTTNEERRSINLEQVVEVISLDEFAETYAGGHDT